MSTNTLLIVEGPHDLEFCARLLKPGGFSRIQSFAKLKSNHAFWLPSVPEKWPHADDLLARHPTPLFLANSAGQSIAVVNAAGINKIARRLGFTLSNLSLFPDAVGVILDADDSADPQQRVAELCVEIARLPDAFASRVQWPDKPGVVNFGPPRSGIFVMPDNAVQGTLEDLLLETAESAYPKLLHAAHEYTASARENMALQADDLEEFNKPAGSKKAVVAAMASILKPGKAIQVSIQDNRWLEPASLELPRIKALKGFLEALVA